LETVVGLIFAKPALRQRIIALVAAYAIAFASLVASFLAAKTAAEAAAQPDVVICHSIVADQQAPASDRNDGKICADCCTGCIASLAMAIPPSVSAAYFANLVAKRLDLPTRWVRPAEAKSSAHRSRGPPSTL
jgi:hypothetical protein